MTPTVDIRYANPAKGLAEFDVYPYPGAEAHRIAYLKSEGWWCTTCDRDASRGRKRRSAGRRCQWITAARNHPDTPDMEGK